MGKGRVVLGHGEVLSDLYPGQRAGGNGVFRFLEGCSLKVSFEWFGAIPEDTTRTNAQEVYQDGLHFRLRKYV